MNTLLNKFMMVIVAVVMVVGFSAFKMVEKSKSRQTDWYEVGPSTSNPNILEVKSLFTGTPVIGFDNNSCATLNEGEMCAIQLTLSENADNPFGRDLDDISTDPEILVGQSAFHPED